MDHFQPACFKTVDCQIMNNYNMGNQNLKNTKGCLNTIDQLIKITILKTITKYLLFKYYICCFGRYLHYIALFLYYSTGIIISLL